MAKVIPGVYKPQISNPTLDLGNYGHSLTADYNRSRHCHHFKKEKGEGGMVAIFWFLVIGTVLCLLFQ